MSEQNNKRECYDNSQSQMTSPDQGKSESFSEVSMSCPPALRCLVFLWEQICANCIQVIQRNGLAEQSNIKDSMLNDEQNISDIEVRKSSEIKKGNCAFNFNCYPNII